MIAKEWLPVQVSRNGPYISHLFFADVVLFFTKARASQASLVMDVMGDFEAALGA